MNERKALSLVFALPSTGAMLYWLKRHPGPEEAPAIAAAVFGSLAFLVLAGAVILPFVLRRVRDRALARKYELAAVEGAELPVAFTFAWSIIFLPIDPKPRVILGLSGAVISLIALVWIERRLRRRTP